MADNSKPRHISGYSEADTLNSVSACLTVAATLGSYLEDLCIVGGLVPSMIIDLSQGPEPETGDLHSGTNDLDVGLSIALLGDEKYAEISSRLRQEGFEPDENVKGNTTPQRWKYKEMNVRLDFLLPEEGVEGKPARIQMLEEDFAAIVIPGLEIAFEERLEIELEGTTLQGHRLKRAVPFCGPGAFVVLKSLALNGRAEPKDAYDLVYTLRRWPGGTSEVAGRISKLAEGHRSVVEEALGILERDFDGPSSIGSARAAEFVVVPGEDIVERATDAFGYVDDLLRECRELGLSASSISQVER